MSYHTFGDCTSCCIGCKHSHDGGGTWIEGVLKLDTKGNIESQVRLSNGENREFVMLKYYRGYIIKGYVGRGM